MGSAIESSARPWPAESRPSSSRSRIGSSSLQKPNGVGNRRAILAGALGDFLLREVKFVGEALERARLLDRVEVFALEIFDQRHLERHLVADVANNRGNAAESGALRGAPAAFAGDQLKALPDAANHERLNDAAHANRSRQFFERLFAESRARLKGAGIDEVYIDLEEHVTRSQGRRYRCRCSRPLPAAAAEAAGVPVP